MRIQRLFVYLYSAAALATSLVIGLVLVLMGTLSDVNSSQEARYQSYLLADELRQSSDDLTRMARTYAVTGDPIFEERYWRILAIRNGETSRPVDYERIYWDLVTEDGPDPRPDGAPVPLSTLMDRQGFTESELAKLREAQNNSDALVRTETVVMNAVKGLFDDGSGDFVVRGEPNMEQAIRLMHDQAYHAEKARIMKPIDEFFEMVTTRTEQAVRRDLRLAQTLVVIVIGSCGTLLLLTLGSLVLVNKRVGRPIREATETLLRLSAEPDPSAPHTDATQAFATPPPRFRPQDEIGQITQAFQAMITTLRQAFAELKVLRGILPICSHCRKIRDDQGYWNQVEVYFARHADVDFSHGICPSCLKAHYGEVLGPEEDSKGM